MPIPQEHMASGALVQSAIDQALTEAKEQDVTGADTTPFLLERIRQLTKGESLASNIELVKNNARVGSLVAVALSRLRQPGSKL